MAIFNIFSVGQNYTTEEAQRKIIDQEAANQIKVANSVKGYTAKDGTISAALTNQQTGIANIASKVADENFKQDIISHRNLIGSYGIETSSFLIKTLGNATDKQLIDPNWWAQFSPEQRQAAANVLGLSDSNISTLSGSFGAVDVQGNPIVGQINHQKAQTVRDNFEALRIAEDANRLGATGDRSSYNAARKAEIDNARLIYNQGWYKTMQGINTGINSLSAVFNLYNSYKNMRTAERDLQERVALNRANFRNQAKAYNSNAENTYGGRGYTGQGKTALQATGKDLQRTKVDEEY